MFVTLYGLVCDVFGLKSCSFSQILSKKSAFLPLIPFYSAKIRKKTIIIAKKTVNLQKNSKIAIK